MATFRVIQEGEILQQERIGCGGFADVYSGLWVDGEREGTGKLAVKIFRKVKTENDPVTLQTFQRRLSGEISTWLSAQPHPNILPFIGVYEHEREDDPNQPPALVSPLREAGDILNYLAKNKISYRPLALGIANGLAHLHAHNIIHGDLKPRNVLIHVDVDGKVTPEISDFGRAKILDVKGYTGSLHTTRKYTAPEVLVGSHTPDSPVVEITRENENVLLSKASDVWSLGMVLLHVLSGQEPYPGLSEGQLVLALDKGKEPRQDEYPKMASCPVRAMVWPLLQRCWKLAEGPSARCSAKDFADELRVPLSAHN